MRVLALACKPLKEEEIRDAKAENMIFLGLAAMTDPPRPESKMAVADAKKAGIRTVMITGDHKETAAAIASEIGIFTAGDLKDWKRSPYMPGCLRNIRSALWKHGRKKGTLQL